MRACEESDPSESDLSRSDSYPLLSTVSGVSSSRVDRLLKERIRRSQSGTCFPHNDSADQLPLLSEHPADSVIIVANRLPVSAWKEPDGSWALKVSIGGLVSALMGLQNFQIKWIGWPGVCVDPGPDRDKLDAALKDKNFIPVWLDQKTCDEYYNGFCNTVLWTLFHYVPLSLDSWHTLAGTQSMQNQWAAYQRANRSFADTILGVYGARDIVWLHDYHLMLCPAMLKDSVPKMKVGWFLHTPFPSSEIYRTLPVREEVLKAVLRADLIGFHTYDYSRHFISSCSRILGLEGKAEGVEDHGHLSRVVACPIGINVERFRVALKNKDVQEQIEKLRVPCAGRKVMLGVDRLDMIKGIPQKLLAFEKFLEEHEEWREQVVLVQIAVPSRTDVPEYVKLRSMVHEMVGRINGKYGTLTYMPIHHLDRSLNFVELVALYAVTDVALVTSLRDGMNLVSYEYVVCQKRRDASPPGVLVLSEFAGAAQSLGAGSILVNPWNTTDMAQAISDALSMSDEERRERHQQNYLHITKHTAQSWADNFITELNDTHIEADLRHRQQPPQEILDTEEVIAGYNNGQRRLVVLGYNATLTTAVEAPRQPRRHYDQMKALARVNPNTIRCIKEMCQHPENTVMIFSGSECSKLEDTFGNLPVWLVAENGVYMRPPAPVAEPEWIPIFDRLPKDWMDSVQMVFDYFCERTPRSFVETRDTSLVWNFKYADVEFGRMQAMDLLQHLRTGPISSAPVDIIPGARSVEVRPVGITKGLTMQHIIGEMERILGLDAICFDFVMCIGHFLSKDENIFSYFEGESINTETRLERGPFTPNTVAVEPDSKVPYGSLGSNGFRGSVSPGHDTTYHYGGHENAPVLTPKYLFTCSVGRAGSKARYSLGGSSDVAELLCAMTNSAREVDRASEGKGSSVRSGPIDINTSRTV
ncbi:hypothetical protein BSKO_01308 [Bryopsis sp. KO-2023]|nr:hypothetical protein BSKO_01308 [Bryopsis sp. KO-2023]